MAALAAAAGALCFAAIAAFFPETPGVTTASGVFILKLLLVDVPGLFLLFWLMPRLAASRMAARFLLAPLLAAVAGLVLEHVLPPLRGALGLLLLAAGSGWLAFAPGSLRRTEKPRSAWFLVSRPALRPTGNSCG